MSALQIVPRPVYRAPTANRCFLTKRAAARAEAAAIIKAKYPNEIDDETHHHWWWGDDPRLVAVHAKLVRRILRKATP